MNDYLSIRSSLIQHTITHHRRSNFDVLRLHTAAFARTKQVSFVNMALTFVASVSVKSQLRSGSSRYGFRSREAPPFTIVLTRARLYFPPHRTGEDGAAFLSLFSFLFYMF